MLFDWFTFAAQVFNFLVLVLLLKRFLYGPIVKAMEEREQRIASQIEEAARQRQEAQAQAEEYRRNNLALEEAKREMLAQANKEAQERRQGLIKQARAEVREMSAHWKDELRASQEAFLGEVRRRIGREVLAAAGRTVKDLAGAELQPLMLKAFIHRLEALDPIPLAVEKGAEGPGVAMVRTGFALSHGQRRELETALRRLVGAKTEINLAAPQKGFQGLDLQVGGYRLAWTPEDYLAGLENEFVQVLESLRHNASSQAGEKLPEQDGGQG